MAEKKIDVHYDFKGNEIRNAILIGGAGNEVKKLHQVTLTAGQLTTTLPELPAATYEVVAEVNGLNINFTLVGVNFTIIEYTSGTIEDGMVLKIYYFK